MTHRLDLRSWKKKGSANRWREDAGRRRSSARNLAFPREKANRTAPPPSRGREKLPAREEHRRVAKTIEGNADEGKLVQEATRNRRKANRQSRKVIFSFGQLRREDRANFSSKNTERPLKTRIREPRSPLSNQHLMERRNYGHR